MTRITRRAACRAALTGLASVPLLTTLSLGPTFADDHPENAEHATGDDRAAVRRVLEEVRRKYDLPAMAGAFVTPHSITPAAVGLRRRDKPDVVTTADRFQLGSCTKSMTSTLAGLLVERGKIRWDTTVAQSFPDFASSIHPLFKNVTLTQLLAHRGGVLDLDTVAFFGVVKYKGTPRRQRLEFAHDLLTQAPASPVDAFHYANAGYSIVGAMLENAANDSFEYMLRRLLFVPLETHVTFGYPGHDDPGQPWGHYTYGGQTVPLDPNADGDPATVLQRYQSVLNGNLIPTPEDISELYNLFEIQNVYGPAGGVCLSTVDFARYAQMHLRGLLGQPTLLTAETMRRLHTPVGDSLNQGTEYYALGWAKDVADGVPTWYHFGSGDPFYALIAIQPTRGIATVSMTNAGPDNGSEATLAVAEMLRKLLP